MSHITEAEFRRELELYREEHWNTGLVWFGNARTDWTGFCDHVDVTERPWPVTVRAVTEDGQVLWERKHQRCFKCGTDPLRFEMDRGVPAGPHFSWEESARTNRPRSIGYAPGPLECPKCGQVYQYYGGMLAQG